MLFIPSYFSVHNQKQIWSDRKRHNRPASPDACAGKIKSACCHYIFYCTGIILAVRSSADFHMVQINWLVTGLAALIPLITGALWYSKILFGNSWMRINRFHPEDMKGANMALIFGLTFVLSFVLAMTVNGIVIHQFTLSSIIQGDNSETAKNWLAKTMSDYGHNFRTFKHGALHGSLASIFMVLPVIGIVALFERRGWKYICIHVGYWFVTLALMGGVICQWT